MKTTQRIVLRFQKEAGKESNDRSVALMRFLSRIAKRLGVAEHAYVVGGAVRNWILGQPIKDIDVVFDSMGAGKGRDSAWFAEAVQKAISAKSHLTTNQYGVAILTVSGPWILDGIDMQGEVIEIANARKESYGGAEGKGYKPHMVEPATIEEDLIRREFSFNTLLWRLMDLEEGPGKAEVLDLLGKGKRDLAEGMLRTPANPDKTFSDDPTRMLRAIKFITKYNFKVPPDVVESIRRNAPKLKKMPWDAVRKILVGDILEGPNPKRGITLMVDLGLSDVLREMLAEEPGFAAALSRSLSDKEASLLLDLIWELKWAVRTPISFLSSSQQVELKTILLTHDADFGRDFVEALKKPPIDQSKLFDKYRIPPKDRGIVVNIARELLLQAPEIPVGRELTLLVDASLVSLYPVE